MTTPRESLLAHALSFPDAWEDHPWGESVAKVGKKVFVFFGTSDDFGMSVKLPSSAAEVLAEEYAEPTGYGLGKSGWVTIKLKRRGGPGLAQCRAWIEESFLAVAPKKIAKRFVEGN